MGDHAEHPRESRLDVRVMAHVLWGDLSRGVERSQCLLRMARKHLRPGEVHEEVGAALRRDALRRYPVVSDVEGRCYVAEVDG